MVKFESQFVATKFPGYFFNTEDDQLYSMKVDGVLKPLKFYTPTFFNHIEKYRVKLSNGETVISKGGYFVSVKGRRKFYAIEALRDIKEHDAIIPVKD